MLRVEIKRGKLRPMAGIGGLPASAYFIFHRCRCGKPSNPGHGAEPAPFDLYSQHLLPFPPILLTSGARFLSHSLQIRTHSAQPVLPTVGNSPKAYRRPEPFPKQFLIYQCRTVSAVSSAAWEAPFRNPLQRSTHQPQRINVQLARQFDGTNQP